MKYDDNSDLAVGGSRQRILNSPAYSRRKTFCFDPSESITTYQPALLIRNDFPLKSKVNDIIQNAFEGGLFLKWNRASQRKKERIIPFEVKPAITLEQYSIALVLVIGGGFFVASLTFFAEMIIQWQSSSNRFWTAFECIVDGKRHLLRNLPEKIKAK